MMLLFMTLENQIDMGDGDIDGYSSPGSQSSPTTTTNKQTTAANNGNTGAANANNSAKPTVKYEGTEYQINATVPYKRPTNATTVAQKKAVNQPNAKCVTCGTSQGPFNADHKKPLAIEHISTGTIDKTKMRSVKAVQPQCKGCSNSQGGQVRKVSRQANKVIKKPLK